LADALEDALARAGPPVHLTNATTDRRLAAEWLARFEAPAWTAWSPSGLAQPNVSAHLACLWDCGLVARQRHGREVYYRLVPGVAEVLAAADRVLAVAGETVGACPRYGAGIATKESV
jgi:ArsR family transcriptional regulator, cadmium/lead-responsive transcriptional repressor